VLLDHYLEVLRIKPGALPGSTALAQARESGEFTPPMTLSGPQPERPTATLKPPGNSSTSFYFTDPWRPGTLSAGSARPYVSGP
jgi:hypothetical protein